MASSKSRKRRKRRTRAAAAADKEHTGGAEKAATPAAPKSRRPAGDEPPPAPWGSFPLVELCVLAAIVMLILGFFVVGGSRGAILIAAGLALGSIGGLELSIREHFAGYRSHTAVLAGVPALIVLGLLFYLGPSGLPQLARAAIGVAVFVAAALPPVALGEALSALPGDGDRYLTDPEGESCGRRPAPAAGPGRSPRAGDWTDKISGVRPASPRGLRREPRAGAVSAGRADDSR